jgi:hypothetical protein
MKSMARLIGLLSVIFILYTIYFQPPIPDWVIVLVVAMNFIIYFIAISADKKTKKPS